jgi:hypothetical protein
MFRVLLVVTTSLLPKSYPLSSQWQHLHVFQRRVHRHQGLSMRLSCLPRRTARERFPLLCPGRTKIYHFTRTLVQRRHLHSYHPTRIWRSIGTRLVARLRTLSIQKWISTWMWLMISRHRDQMLVARRVLNLSIGWVGYVLYFLQFYVYGPQILVLDETIGTCSHPVTRCSEYSSTTARPTAVRCKASRHLSLSLRVSHRCYSRLGRV